MQRISFPLQNLSCVPVLAKIISQKVTRSSSWYCWPLHVFCCISPASINISAISTVHLLYTNIVYDMHGAWCSDTFHAHVLSSIIKMKIQKYHTVGTFKYEIYLYSKIIQSEHYDLCIQLFDWLFFEYKTKNFVKYFGLLWIKENRLQKLWTFKFQFVR